MANSDDGNGSAYASRKFTFAIYTSLLIVALSCVAGRFAGLAAQLPTAVMGLLGVLTIYTGGNVGHNYINTKFGLPDAGDDSTVVTAKTTTVVASSPPTTTSTETTSVIKGPAVPAEVGSMTIVKGSPADCDGEATEECSE